LVLVIALVTTVVVLAQPFVQNVAAGAVVPFWVGHQIETFKAIGTVTNQGLRHTEIDTLDRRRFIIPHSEVLANPIVIYSTAERRRSNLDV
jgi:small-conductance mechanosensitive channel